MKGKGGAGMTAQERVANMGTQKLLPLLFSMAVPAILANVVNALYNVGDRLFVGRLVGSDALGAVGLTFPLSNITGALTIMLSIGGGAMLSLSLGQHKTERTNEIFTSICVVAFVVALLISGGFFFFAGPLVQLCGAGESSALYPIAVSYLKITAFGQFFSIMNLALAAVIRAEGNTRYAMVVTMSGALLNCGLDAIFMMAFHMGVEGAALGTVIGQIVSCLMSLQYYVRGLGVSHFLGVRSFRPSTAVRVASLGLAPSVFQALSFVNNILVNQSLRHYADLELGAGGGDMALSAVSVMQTVENLAIMFIMGMNNAVSTVISYNYGSGQYDRVRKATLTGQVVATIVSILLWAAMLFTPNALFSLFSPDSPELAAYGALAMRRGKLFIFGLGFQTLASMYYSAIGKPKRAVLISISRNGLFLIPSLLLLPLFFGLDGVLCATSVSDGCSLVLVACLYAAGLRELSRQSGRGASAPGAPPLPQK